MQITNRFTGAIIIDHEAESIRAVLEAAVKSVANLSRASLSRADLSRADLSRADLSGADLSGADLSRADLPGADLSGADLSEANLSGADLSEANLSRADLSGADLSGADLSRADLSGANLSGANLSGADLTGANLFRANLNKTVLDPANIPNAQVDGFVPVPAEPGWVYGYRTRATSAAGLTLRDNRIYGCEVFSTSDDECHPGWYLWPTPAASRKFRDSDGGHIQVKARVIDIHKPGEGNKWRARAIWVIGGAARILTIALPTRFKAESERPTRVSAIKRMEEL